MGVTNRQLFKIVLIQASIVGLIGYALGIGFTAAFFEITKNAPALKGFMLYWQVIAGSFLAISIIILASITFSLRKVFNLDPAIVFRG